MRLLIDDLCLPAGLRRYKSKSFWAKNVNEETTVPVKIVFEDVRYMVTVAIAEEERRQQLSDKGLNTVIIDEASVVLVS